MRRELLAWPISGLVQTRTGQGEQLAASGGGALLVRAGPLQLATSTSVSRVVVSQGGSRPPHGPLHCLPRPNGLHACSGGATATPLQQRALLAEVWAPRGAPTFSSRWSAP